MNLTLATCALGVLGLTPVLHGALGDPTAPAPPVPPAPVPAIQALASTPLAPATPTSTYVALLRQHGQHDLSQEANRLKDEIARLRHDLAAMQKELRKTGRDARKGRSSHGRRGRTERERVEEVREDAEELREEARAQGRKFLVGRSENGRLFQWRTPGGDEAEPMILRFEHDGDRKGHRMPGPDFRSGGRIDAGGPNTFNIHVEDGDVHIHTSGGANINTGKVPQDKSHEVRLFGRLEAGDGPDPDLELNINGKEINVKRLRRFLSDADGHKGGFPRGLVLDATRNLNLPDLSALIKLQGLENLECLEALEGLENLEDLIEMDIDFSLNAERLPGLKGLAKAISIRIDVCDDDDECCDEEDCDMDCEEECEEEECEEIEEVEEEESRDGRFVFASGFAPSFFAEAPSVGGQNPAWPAQKAYFVTSQPRPMGVPSTEEQLLELARQIQADVQAMRAELNELRTQVLSAPRRR